MIDVEIDTSEMKRVVDALNDAGPKAKQGASSALTTVSADLRSESSAAAPVGPTGRLSGGIGVTGGDGWRRVSTNVDYAVFVEWGTYKDAPQPFMMPAGARAWAQLAGLIERVGVEAVA